MNRLSRIARRRQTGFTLVELLVVIAIMLIIVTMTAAALKVTVDGDKVRAGARQIQSMLAGARDRAIYARAPRGLRLILDANDINSTAGGNNPRTVASLAYVGPSEPWSDGAVTVERLDANNDGDLTDVNDGSPVVIRPTSELALWQQLVTRKLLVAGARIRIPASDGKWYQINQVEKQNPPFPLSEVNPINTSINPSVNHATLPAIIISEPFQYTGSPTNNGTLLYLPNGENLTYELELPPTLLPGQEPVPLPSGVVIHLDRCSRYPDPLPKAPETISAGQQGNDPASLKIGRGSALPEAWKQRGVSQVTGDPTGFVYNGQLDIMFSPRGVITGTAATKGIIHLYIADRKDADRDRAEWGTWFNPTTAPPLTDYVPEYGPRTPIDATERRDKFVVTIFTRTGAVSTHPVSQTVGDPFYYAETGEVAGR